MAYLHVSLFGRFDVQREGQTLTGFDVRKIQELFTYLLLYRDRPHPREKLADLLWCETSLPRTRRYLRKTLWQLQAALNPGDCSDENCVLLVEPDWIQLNPSTDIWLDIALFEEAFELAKGIPGKSLESQQVWLLQSATGLYHGDLLEGCYQDWCLYERERFQHMYLAMLDKLMAYCEAHGHHELGLSYGARILRYDCARERTHRRLMRLHYLNRDRTSALRQYERCVRALDEELAVGPARRTVVLHTQIENDQLPGYTATPSGAGVSEEVSLRASPRILGYLGRLRSFLADVQGQVEHEIDSVELALKRQH